MPHLDSPSIIVNGSNPEDEIVLRDIYRRYILHSNNGTPSKEFTEQNSQYNSILKNK
jgi:hypothetical protein